MHALERLLTAMHAFHFYVHVLDYSRPLVVDGGRSLSGGEYDWHISNARPACEGAYGAQRPGHDQAWRRPRRSAQRYPLQSLLVSIPSIIRVRLTRIKTGINTISSGLVSSEPDNRELSLDHTYHQPCSPGKHTRLNLAYSDWSVYEFSKKNTIESVNGVFGCAVDSTYLSDRIVHLSLGAYLLSMVLDQRLSPD